MIRLDNMTVKLQIVLAGNVATNQLDCAVSFTDHNISNELTRGATKRTNTNQTTDVDICDALGSGKNGYVRNIDSISIYNKDTASATVTVKYDDGGTEHIIAKIVLATLEQAHYEHGYGWKCLTTAGAIK